MGRSERFQDRLLSGAFKDRLGVFLDTVEPLGRSPLDPAGVIQEGSGLLGVFYDFQCGFKAFSSELAYQLFDESFKTRWFFDTELFMRSRMIQDVSFIEVPLDVWIDCAGSKLKPIDFVMTLPNLFLIYMYYRQANKFAMRKRFKYVFRD